MVVDPRINDRELAAINAAAVTREYRVQPHLGMSTETYELHAGLPGLTPFLQITALYQPSMGRRSLGCDFFFGLTHRFIGHLWC
jgi:hypothetical protein